MLRVYLDANAVIYYVERHSTIYPLLKQRMVAADGAPLIHCVSSELVRLEVRVLPLRNANTSLLARFDEFFTTFSAHAVHLDRQVFDLATALRAQYKLNTPDALHLAAAFVAGCDEFWTNDKRLANAAQGRLQIVTFESTP